MTKFLMYFAMAVGAVLITAWIAREFNYFFNSLWYLMRYNWLPFFGSLVLIAIAYKVLSSKS
jgi:hypothetical protein